MEPSPHLFTARPRILTDQYLAFASHHPVSHKAAVVRTLMSRADKLSSSDVQRAEEDCRGTKKSGYPSSFIHKHSCPTKCRQEVDDRRPKTTVALSYIKGLSKAVRWILVLLDVNVAFHPLNTLHKMLVHPKDPVPSDQCKGVVYSIPYDGCHKVYIGQTGWSVIPHLH